MSNGDTRDDRSGEGGGSTDRSGRDKTENTADAPTWRFSRRTLLKTAGVGLPTAALVGSGLTTSAAAADAYPSGVGINLGGMEGRGGIFVDAATTHRPIDAATDENGWPTEDFVVLIFDQRPAQAWVGDIDDPQEYVPDLAGTYDVSFSGRADVSIQFGPGTIRNVTYDASTNTTTFQVDLPSQSEAGVSAGLLGFSFSNTQRSDSQATNTGITDLAVIRPGYSPETTRTFTDAWLSLIEPFPVHRYMDWLHTNNWSPFDGAGPVWTRWVDRTTPDDATQKRGPGGVAWEYVIENANATGSDAWINVPVGATDEYVRTLAEMLQRDLDSGIDVIVEYSNELWNFGFQQYSWNKQMALRQTNEGSNLDYDGTTDEETLANRRVFQRCVELSQIFADVFGYSAVNDRIKVLYPWNPIRGEGETRDGLQYVQDNYGDPASFGWGFIRTAYFDYGSPDAADGVQAVLDQMQSNVPNYDDAWRSLAESWGLHYVIYEGGPNTSPGLEGDTTNVADRIRAARSDRMGDLLTQNVTDFLGAGGDLYMHFTIQSGYNRYGTWGATDDVTRPNRNAKYPALLDLAGTSSTETPTDETPTGEGIAVGDGTARDLNGDGLYRDVNGNGRVDNDDVVTYFEEMNDQGISNDVGAFDYNANGRIDFDDVVTLFEEV